MTKVSKCIVNGNALRIICEELPFRLLPVDWWRAFSQRCRFRLPCTCMCPLWCISDLVFKSSLHYIAYYMFKAQFSSNWKCSAIALSRPELQGRHSKNKGKKCRKCSAMKSSVWVTCLIVPKHSVSETGEDPGFPVSEHTTGLNLKLLFLLMQSNLFYQTFSNLWFFFLCSSSPLSIPTCQQGTTFNKMQLSLYLRLWVNEVNCY